MNTESLKADSGGICSRTCLGHNVVLPVRLYTPAQSDESYLLHPNLVVCCVCEWKYQLVCSNFDISTLDHFLFIMMSTLMLTAFCNGQHPHVGIFSFHINLCFVGICLSCIFVLE